MGGIETVLLNRRLRGCGSAGSIRPQASASVANGTLPSLPNAAYQDRSRLSRKATRGRSYAALWGRPVRSVPCGTHGNRRFAALSEFTTLCTRNQFNDLMGVSWDKICVLGLGSKFAATRLSWREIETTPGYRLGLHEAAATLLYGEGP